MIAKPPNHPPQPSIALARFALLVRSLRVAQKSGGSGYKTPDDSTKATALEKQVDAEICRILEKGFGPLD